MKNVIRTLSLLLLPFVLAGCGDDAPIAEETLVAQLVQASDGVPIVYETHGSGAAAVVFVHCWGCNRQFWTEQIQPIADAGYRVAAMDLPGHGESGADREDWSIKGLADDLHRVLDRLTEERIVLVGHSMGGPVSLAAAPGLGDRLAGIVCVDTLHNAEFEWPEGMTESLVSRMRRDFREGIELFVPQLFKSDADPDLVAWVVDQAVASDQEAAIGLMQDFSNFDMPDMLSNAGVPVRCINAAPDGDWGMPTAIEINRKYADFDAVLMEGVGHYPQLEQPHAFNEQLLALLNELAP